MEQMYSTDEMQDGVIALYVLKQQCENIINTENPQYWSWVIISLHKSVQSFMVLALSGTNNHRLISKADLKRWNEAYMGKGEYPDVRLLKFMELYKRIKCNEMMTMHYNSKVFVPSGNQDKSMESLNKRRNQYIHYLPMSWLVGIPYLIDIFDNCLPILKFLIFDSGNILWYPDICENEAKNLYSEIIVSFGKIKIHYESVSQ